MSWIISLIIGGVVGWLASIVMKTNAQMGWIANVLVGVVGSLLGFWIAGVLGFAPTGSIIRFVVAFAGAVLLIFILGKLGIFRQARCRPVDSSPVGNDAITERGLQWWR
jgi:uncharacterized membrane protein YeaQ/YmgE (transglycosylase-associated protein family)